MLDFDCFDVFFETFLDDLDADPTRSSVGRAVGAGDEAGAGSDVGNFDGAAAFVVELAVVGAWVVVLEALGIFVDLAFLLDFGFCFFADFDDDSLFLVEFFLFDTWGIDKSTVGLAEGTFVAGFAGTVGDGIDLGRLVGLCVFGVFVFFADVFGEDFELIPAFLLLFDVAWTGGGVGDCVVVAFLVG